MVRETCGRCGRDLGDAREGTYYCENCYKLLSRTGSGGLWAATLAVLSVLFLGGAGLALLAPTFGSEISGGWRLLLGLVLTLIPALLWLFFFYSQDQLEPEPHSYVVSIFVLGLLLGGAVEQPLLREVFEVQRWVQVGSMTHLLSSTFLSGILTAALTYLAVRFTVMPTSEFDERVDGIIYGTAAALGLGVAANLTYLMEVGTISLGVGTLHIVVTSLAYATFGGVVGYFLGLIKPGGGPDWLAPLGVLVAGMLHGLYEWMDAQLGTGGLGYNPWPSLIATTVFAGLIFGLIFYLLRRAYQEMLLRVPPERTGA
ncbi:MAG: PrsW family intramembrane metalloprotease [Ardenticatenales bacterium]|nr:PrsW family intramembrane metalloprotease [Ardenticatenales bacterium]